MTITTLLARAFAIYFLVAGLTLIINHRFYQAVLRDLVQSHIAMMLLGFMTLFVGITLISLHNLWDNGWQIAVSSLCWLTLFAGIFRTLFPTIIMSFVPRIFTKSIYLLISGIIAIFFAIVFGYCGFVF